MNITTKTILICLVFLIATVITAVAQPATLAWDQNTEPDVVGYQVYYRTDTATFPFNGTTLAEGASPIMVYGSGNTTLTVNLPDDGKIYYFTATAVSDTGVESGFSDIIASEWIPSLLAPTDNQAVATAATFTWDLPPAGYNVTYELHYGTDPSLAPAAVVGSPPDTNKSGWPQINLLLALPLAILLALLMAIRSGRAKRIWHPVRIGLCVAVFAIQASCGGGGGTDPGSTPIGTTPDDPALPVTTTVVTGIATTAYQVTDLQPGSQYFWKIVAVDDTGFVYESVTQTFTTLGN